MIAMSDKSSVINGAWAWAAVMEYLAATPSVDISVLIEVIEKAPDLPDDLGEIVKERVALLCLEDPFGPSSSALDPKIRIDPSKSCQDVLQEMIERADNYILRGEDVSELVKWDLNSFINDKRLSMPKTLLQQLKEKLFSATCCYAAHMKEISGLDCLVDKDTCTVSESVNKLQENIGDRNLLPTKRHRAVFAAENMGEQCHENLIFTHGSDDIHPKIKRVKDASLQFQHEGGSLTGREIIEDFSDKQAQVTTGEGYQLKKDVLGTLCESNVSGSTEDVHIVSQSPQQSNSDETHQSEVHIHSNLLSQTASIGEPLRISYGEDNDEHQDDEDHSGEPPDGSFPSI